MSDVVCSRQEISFMLKADNFWIYQDCWVASFDILGFKDLAKVEHGTFRAAVIQKCYEHALRDLERTNQGVRPAGIDYSWVSDTFIMFTSDDSSKSFAVMLRMAKSFFEHCLSAGIPVRGAVSVGPFVRSRDNRSLISSAFIDAFEIGERQNWVGLLLSPKAIARARRLGLEPSRLGFVSSKDIPMKKCKSPEIITSRDVMAYRFERVRDVIPQLEAMMSGSSEPHRIKYQRTIDFIRAYSRPARDGNG
jgi:hypothetical protein